MSQVVVLDGPDPHPGGDLGPAIGRQVRAVLVDDLPGVLLGLIQQGIEPNGLSLASLEGLSIGPHHGAERNELQADVVADVAGLAGGLKDHGEVLSLTRVMDVNDPVGAKMPAPVAQRRQIEGGVQVRAVSLTDDQGQFRAVLGGEKRLAVLIPQEHAQRAGIIKGQAPLLEFGEHRAVVLGVGAFALNVFGPQPDAQAVVDRLTGL